MALFKPRQFDSTDAASRRSFLADSTEVPLFTALATTAAYSAAELTKNDKYCVSRLPAVPPVLSGNRMDDAGDILNGYADNNTKCSLVLSDRAINVWPHNSTDDLPLTFEFPLDDEALHLAILTRPTPGTTLDPGLVIINSTTGNVRFYESLQHAPALGLINSKLIETTIGILAAQGEYITLAENVEPAGVVVATSWRRVVLVLLRDGKGAPKLSTLELIGASKALRFFSGWLGGSGDDLSDDIVSIKSGRITGHGSVQEIIVQDAAGTFKKFVFQSSTTGAPFINHRKTVLYRLASYLENNIDGFIPGSVFDIKFLDLWPLPLELDESDPLENLYTALMCVQSSMHGVDEKRLLSITLKINNSGVMVFGSHQLPDVASELNAAEKPKLFIPSPGKTAFVVVGNSVIMTDINTSFKKSISAGFPYYEPKWEDVINFKTSVQIIGSGYENQDSTKSNPSLILITRDFGVLRIERFPDSSNETANEDEDPTDPVYILKSHIQQAIYYHESDAVDFDVGAEYPVDVVTQAVSSVVAELLDSSSVYLPPFFSSTRDLFALRVDIATHLIHYVKRNFVNCWFAVLPEVVEALEKLKVALNLWNIIDTESQEAVVLKDRIRQIIKDHDFVSNSPSQDVIRSFFTFGVGNILTVLTELIEKLARENYLLKTLVKILASTLHDGVFCSEQEYIVGINLIPPQKLWVFDSKLLVLTEEVYNQAYCASNEDFQYLGTAQRRQELVAITESLYFLITSAILYMQDTDNDQLGGYVEWYHLRKGSWVSALLKHGLTNEALSITEKYQDFYSLAAVLEKESEQRSGEYVRDKTNEFLNKYGYAFASKLFEYYIKKDKIQHLLLGFEQWQPYLEQYFRTNPKSSNKIGWIHYLRTNNFKEAASVLVLLSSSEETDNQEAREFNYSLAKLAAVAATVQDPQSSDNTALEQIAIDAENNLVCIRIQNRLHHLILQFVQDKKELVTLDYFLAHFENPSLPKLEVSKQIEPFFQRFVDLLPLLKEQLILLLTSIGPKSQFTHVFADALKAAALIGNDRIFRQQATQVWQTLLVYGDDWTTISNTSDNTDEVNKMKIRETALFTTVRDVHENKEIMAVLDEVVRLAEQGQGESELDGKVRDLVASSSLPLWINTIKAEAR